jgi:hypothetical protein
MEGALGIQVSESLIRHENRIGTELCGAANPISRDQSNAMPIRFLMLPDDPTVPPRSLHFDDDEIKRSWKGLSNRRTGIRDGSNGQLGVQSP